MYAPVYVLTYLHAPMHLHCMSACTRARVCARIATNAWQEHYRNVRFGILPQSSLPTLQGERDCMCIFVRMSTHIQCLQETYYECQNLQEHIVTIMVMATGADAGSSTDGDGVLFR